MAQQPASMESSQNSPWLLLAHLAPWQKFLLWLVSFLVAGWLVYWNLPNQGQVMRVVVFLPTFVAALCWGARAGLLFGVAGSALGLFISQHHGLAISGSFVGPASHLALGWAVGHMRNLHLALNRELAQTRAETLRKLDENRELNESVEAAQKTFGNLTKLLPETVFESDAQGNITFVNRAGLRQFGFEPADLITGITVLDVVPETEKKIAANYWKALARGSKPGLIRFMARRKNGSLFPAMMTAAAREESGGIAGYIGVVVDITAQEEHDASLRQNEERLRLVMDFTNDWEYWIGPDKKLWYVSPSCLRISGYNQEEFMTRPRLLSELVHPEDQEIYRSHIKEAGGGEESLEFRIINRAGEERWIHHVCRPVFGQDGSALGRRASNRDITERRLAEEKLKKQEERLNLALQATSDGLWDWNLVTGEVYFSPVYFTMLGYQPDELPHGYETWKSLLHPDDLQTSETQVMKHIQGKIGHFSLEFRLATKGGGWKWVLGRGKVVEWDEKGNPVRMVGTHVDLTDRKKAEEELRRAAARLEQRVADRTRELAQANQALTKENLSRRLAEIEVTKQRDRAQGYLDIAGTILVALDTRGRVSMINRKGAELLGAPEKEILGLPWFETFLSPQGGPPERQRFDSLMKGEIISIPDHESRVAGPQGRERLIFWRTAVLSDGNGRPAGTLSSGEDVTSLRAAEAQLQESRAYLRTVLETMQAGILVIDAESHIIVDANRHALSMIGRSYHEVIGQPCQRFVCPSETGECPVSDLGVDLDNSERVLLDAQGRQIPILKSVAVIKSGGADCLLESFIDIRQMKALLQEQEMDAKLAKGILNHTAGALPRHIPMAGGLELVSSTVYLPCSLEGGDHFFLRRLAGEGGAAKTFISVKDQSGHRVGCLLRSIITDTLHQEILGAKGGLPLSETTGILNRTLLRQGLFSPDDFVAASLAEVDHQTLLLTYCLAGHHSLFLLRGGQAIELPGENGPGRNIPLGAFLQADYRCNQIQLAAGDLLLFYTDGLSDALRADGAGPGLASTLKSLAGEHPGQFAQDLLERMAAAAETACGRAINLDGENRSLDDITMVGLDVVAPGWQGEEVWRPRDLPDLAQMINRFVDRQREAWLARGFRDPGRLQTALEEAGSNAFLHGNGGRPGSAIAVAYRYGSDFLLSLSDQGHGFDFLGQAVRDADEPGQAQTGQGLTRIRQAASELVFSRGGATVSISFDRRTGRERQAMVYSD